MRWGNGDMSTEKDANFRKVRCCHSCIAMHKWSGPQRDCTRWEITVEADDVCDEWKAKPDVSIITRPKERDLISGM